MIALTPDEQRLLQSLDAEQKKVPADLQPANETTINSDTVTLQRLEQRGLVTGTGGSDHKMDRQYVISEDGQKALYELEKGKESK